MSQHALADHKVLGERAFAAHLWVDGTSDDTFQGDATQGPWAVFDIYAQENIAGPFDSDQEARDALLTVLDQRATPVTKASSPSVTQVYQSGEGGTCSTCGRNEIIELMGGNSGVNNCVECGPARAAAKEIEKLPPGALTCERAEVIERHHLKWFRSQFCADHQPEVDESWTQYGCPVCEAGKENVAAVTASNQLDDARKELVALKDTLRLVATNRERLHRELLEALLPRIRMSAIVEDGVVYIGYRHGDIVRRIAEVVPGYRDPVTKAILKPVTGEQGFVTMDGRFVDRLEGAKIALAAGQVIKRGSSGELLGPSDKLNWPPLLYSEDLY